MRENNKIRKLWVPARTGRSRSDALGRPGEPPPWPAPPRSRGEGRLEPRSGPVRFEVQGLVLGFCQISTSSPPHPAPTALSQRRPPPPVSPGGRRVSSPLGPWCGCVMGASHHHRLRQPEPLHPTSVPSVTAFVV